MSSRHGGNELQEDTTPSQYTNHVGHDLIIGEVLIVRDRHLLVYSIPFPELNLLHNTFRSRYHYFQGFILYERVHDQKQVAPETCSGIYTANH